MRIGIFKRRINGQIRIYIMQNEFINLKFRIREWILYYPELYLELIVNIQNT